MARYVVKYPRRHQADLPKLVGQAVYDATQIVQNYSLRCAPLVSESRKSAIPKSPGMQAV